LDPDGDIGQQYVDYVGHRRFDVPGGEIHLKLLLDCS
jgi:hypothetical protein